MLGTSARNAGALATDREIFVYLRRCRSNARRVYSFFPPHQRSGVCFVAVVFYVNTNVQLTHGSAARSPRPKASAASKWSTARVRMRSLLRQFCTLSQWPVTVCCSRSAVRERAGGPRAIENSRIEVTFAECSIGAAPRSPANASRGTRGRKTATPDEERKITRRR